ncbi:hypothetical protein NDU88_002752 [Pleurodeles waltl]|uniref:Uncharacterized protein n=1 Tax=Pleurodeles waltl TaxID=8319 RepID=A0AAV7M1L1_PLEWA|nr:hypothetical protein NDU88_002752 [Pleurodeles waltl]
MPSEGECLPRWAGSCPGGVEDVKGMRRMPLTNRASDSVLRSCGPYYTFPGVPWGSPNTKKTSYPAYRGGPWGQARRLRTGVVRARTTEARPERGFHSPPFLALRRCAARHLRSGGAARLRAEELEKIQHRNRPEAGRSCETGSVGDHQTQPVEKRAGPKLGSDKIRERRTQERSPPG